MRCISSEHSLTMKKTLLYLVVASIAASSFVACDNEEPTPVGDTHTFNPDTPNLQTAVQTTLIEMNDNDIVQFTEGTFMFTNTLSIDDKINVTLRSWQEQDNFRFFVTDRWR